MGACAVAPVMVVDGKYYDGVTPSKAIEIIHSLAKDTVEAEEVNKE
jgi:NADH:ubiquinone oxidoreductase subunit E